MQKVKDVAHKIAHPKQARAEREYQERVGATAGDEYYNTTGTTATGTESYGATGGLGATGGGLGVAGASGVAEPELHEGRRHHASHVAGSERLEERVVAEGVAEVPIVVTEQQRVGGMAATEEEVCGRQTFSEVEDRPVVKERVERYVEHHPVEKQYVVETKYVGEREVPSAAGATVVDAKEYVVAAAEPGPNCPASAGDRMAEAMERTRI